jgi:hypothetical protein
VGIGACRMSFHWRRTAGAVVSTCALCGWTVRSTERDVLDQQRGHDAMTCQRRRAEAARAKSPEGQAEARARAGDGWVVESDELLCATTVFGVIPGVESDRLLGHKAAPITSRGLTAKTTKES